MRTKLLISTALLLFAIGFGVDRLWTGSVLAKTRNLEQQRTDLLEKLGNHAESDQEARVMAECMGIDDVNNLDTLGAGTDALVFINRKVAAAGMRQVELISDAVENSTRLRRSDFTMTVNGSYREFASLVRSFEDDPRLVKVVGIRIEAQDATPDLECHLSIAIFDPLSKASS